MTELTNPRHWFAPVPARRLRLVYIAVFGYALAWLVLRVGYVADVASLPDGRFEPVGMLSVLDAPPPKWLVLAIWAASVVACVAVLAGRRVRVAAPVAAAGMLAVATLTSSYGQVFHTEHLLVVHLAILAVAAVVEPSSETPSGWPLNLMMAVVAVTYVDAGIAKLRWSGLDWVSGDVLRTWVAIDNLRKWQLDDLSSPLGGWLAGVAWIWLPIALATLAVELGAPLALVPNRLRYCWIGAAWLFHIGIVALMAISFPYQLTGVAYAAFVPLEVWERSLRDRFATRDVRRAASLSHPPAKM